LNIPFLSKEWYIETNGGLKGMKVGFSQVRFDHAFDYRFSLGKFRVYDVFLRRYGRKGLYPQSKVIF
jgi:hypothetical protein